MTINEIKDNHLKIIASYSMNLSAINLFDNNIEQLSMNTRIEVTKFEPRNFFKELLMRSKIIIWEVLTPYYLQVLHTNEYGIVLVNPIQDTQRKINLREYIMRSPS